MSDETSAALIGALVGGFVGIVASVVGVILSDWLAGKRDAKRDRASFNAAFSPMAAYLQRGHFGNSRTYFSESIAAQDAAISVYRFCLPKAQLTSFDRDCEAYRQCRYRCQIEEPSGNISAQTAVNLTNAISKLMSYAD